MKKEKKPKSRQEDIVIQELDGEVLIYDLEKNKAFCLNKTSALVWQACDGKRTVAQISDLLGKQLKSQTDEDIVWLALDQLMKEKLLVTTPDADGRFAGMSRRDVIRKISVSSMIALPVIAGLIAPQAIHANSACILGGECTCDTPSNGRKDQICNPAPGGACIDANCRCSWKDNGNNTNGNCVP